ncbi:MAG: Uma2 family endonuclease [Oscillibacter sp.]|nr:Uma2 family endonuclease [Oscillibacter sp.]
MNGNLAYKEELEEEIIGGRVVMMASPTLNHIFIAGNIHTLFNNYLKGKQCTPLPDGATLHVQKGERYKPDMMVVCDPSKLSGNGVYGAPDLVVEVLSPSTAHNDKGHKKDVYEAIGVREYWIVSAGDRSIEQYVLENGRFSLRSVFTLYPDYILADMTEEERAAVPTEFRCTLFDDLTVRLEDVFYRTTPGA